MTKSLSILGSTGSIGTQSLDVCRKCGFGVEALTAFSSVEIIEKQAREFNPKMVALVDKKAANDLRIKLADTNIKVLTGIEGVCECAMIETADTVLNSV
ncbi:MAG: 1-deoxy-D-xylulose-5-phosphate reductoisomerase, partial [Oscillospiraceae bacterium]